MRTGPGRSCGLPHAARPSPGWFGRCRRHFAPYVVRITGNLGPGSSRLCPAASRVILSRDKWPRATVSSNAMAKCGLRPRSRSPCHLHAFRIAPAHAQVAVLCDKGQGPAGGIGGMVQLRQAGAFLLRANSCEHDRHLEQRPRSDLGWEARRLPDRSKAMVPRGDVGGSR
jgi:hypothetical protein